ncbi:MAG: hypothetical protein JWM68_4732, partial [Verrucomicrobiales bacterium]|nr:hypothetical protein [Verrucomicrobiales bacterium]
MFSNRLFQTLACALLPLGLFAEGAPSPKAALDAKPLTAAEKFVFIQVIAGKPADLKLEFSDETNRVLRAAFLETLLTRSGTNVHRNGFSIEHAIVPDALDLRNAEVHFETGLIECQFDGEVNFAKSLFENGFSIAGSTFGRSVSFSSMKIRRLANFDRTTFAAEVNAAQLEVTGIFTARKARFNSPTDPVDFTSLKTGADVFFSESTFAGPVTFQAAQIAENWRFDSCLFTNTTALINFEDVKVGAATSFIACRFGGYVSFKDARFAGLDFSKVVWPAVHDDNPSLWLNGMSYTRISAGSEKDSWQNLYNLVQRSAR